MTDDTIKTTFPRRSRRDDIEDFDELGEYFGPWRHVDCPSCSDSAENWPAYWELPRLRGVERATLEVVCDDCGAEHTIEVTTSPTEGGS